MFTESGAAARRAKGTLLAVFTENGAAAGPALSALLAVRALLPDAPDWVRRRGGGRCGRNCCGCLRHGAKVAAKCCKSGWVPFERSMDPLKRHLDAPRTLWPGDPALAPPTALARPRPPPPRRPSPGDQRAQLGPLIFSTRGGRIKRQIWPFRAGLARGEAGKRDKFVPLGWA